MISWRNPSTIGGMGDDCACATKCGGRRKPSANSGRLLSLAERERLVNEVLDETFGLGPLEALMRDPEISDILINGPKTI